MKKSALVIGIFTLMLVGCKTSSTSSGSSSSNNGATVESTEKKNDDKKTSQPVGTSPKTPTSMKSIRSESKAVE